MTHKQLIFELPSRPALGRGDFFVSQSNSIALSLLEDWHNWPERKHTLSGSQGSGKTHLAHVWSAMSGARIIRATEITRYENSQLLDTNLIIEDTPDISGNLAAQEQLFHLHNLFAAEQRFLLFTGRPAPKNWNIDLPDLASRLEGARNAELKDPDDQLFSALLAKLFADLQLFPAPEVIQFLVARLERSFAAAQAFVKVLDATALREQRAITRRLAREVLNSKKSSKY